MYIQVQQNDQLNHVYVNIHYMVLDVLELFDENIDIYMYDLNILNVLL
jgi:uncharacterized Fe-S radical SAM superfamily protein PflX